MENLNAAWKFPRVIEFWMVSDYLNRMEKLSNDETLLLDLRDTENAHSSFIGFLILLKHKLENSGGRLILNMSPSLVKVFSMLNVLEHFTSFYNSKKTA